MRESDAVLLGAVGDPAFDGHAPRRRPEAALLALRRELGVYANLRPARVCRSGNRRSAEVRDRRRRRPVDRSRTDWRLHYGTPRGVAEDGSSAHNTLRYTREEIERVAARAFEEARRRRRTLTSVDKANVLETSRLWRAVVTDISAAYPDVVVDHMYVDNCAMQLVRSPARFDVIVTENMFGDILSDEAGAVVGSLGLLPSASIGSGPGLFEPVHGSAPDLSGRDAANPVGADRFRRDAPALRSETHRRGGRARRGDSGDDRLRCADGGWSPDLRGPALQESVLSCSQMASAITERIHAVSSISAL